MDQSRNYAFVEFTVGDEAALDRLLTVTDQLRRQKCDPVGHDDDDWLPYFTEADRAEFWWPEEDEALRWEQFWISTPLPERHSDEMPTPPWDFSSMIIAIMDGEYDLVGVRKLVAGQARFEISPHAYPYGGLDSVRALVRSFGHKINGFDDGTGYVRGDSQSPRWRDGMPAFKPRKRSFWDRFKRR